MATIEKQVERVGDLYDDGISAYRAVAAKLNEAAVAKVEADAAKIRADQAYVDACAFERFHWESLRNERAKMLAELEGMTADKVLEGKAA